MPEAGLASAAIALGSNLGDRAANLSAAVEHIGGIGRVEAVSAFYATAAVGYTAQPDFLNAALLLRTGLPPRELLSALLDIERRMGRVRENVPAKGPRLIDLDLLLYNDLICAEPGMTVPHPEMHLRGFVLEPLVEIAPDRMHPGMHRTMRQLYSNLGSR